MIPRLITILLIVLYVATFGLLATREHLAFETSTFDLGNYDQAMWNAAHGRGLALTTVPTLTLNRMGLHVEPTLFLFVPLYRLWPNPLLLLWLQTLALGLAAWPLYLLARKRLASVWGGVVVVLAYLLLPATEAVNMFEFHAVALSPFFMLWGIYFLDQALAAGGGYWHKPEHPPAQFQPRPMVFAFFFIILAMGTKEDVPLHVFMLGLYVMFWLRHRWLGFGLAMLGLIWAAVAFGWIIPAYRVGGEQSAYVDYFPTLGSTPLEIALSPFTKPAEVWPLITAPADIAALRMLTLPLGFLNLIGLPIFILTAPSLAIVLLSNNPFQQELETFHYAAPMLPFVMLATVDGLTRLRGWLSRWGAWPGAVLLVLLLLTSLGYHYLRGYSPLSRPFHWPQVTPHHRLGHKIAATIPPDARVVAQAELGPHLTQREQVSVWTGSLPAAADYIILDVAHPRFINLNQAHDALLSNMIHKKRFGFTRTQDGYMVLKQGAERIPFQVGFQDFLFGADRWRTEPVQGEFGDWLALVGSETHTYREREPEVTLYFHVLAPPPQDYFIHLYLLDETGQPVGATDVQQPVLTWWPINMWQPGDVIKIRFNTLTWWTGDGNRDRFSYAVALLSKDQPWEPSARLPVSGVGALPNNLVFVHSFERVAGMVYPLSSEPETGR